MRAPGKAKDWVFTKQGKRGAQGLSVTSGAVNKCIEC